MGIAMLIRSFQPNDAEPLRRVVHSSVHGLARFFYNDAQLQAWVPDAYDQNAWAQKITALQPWVVEVNSQVVAYADLQANGLIDHFFVAQTAAGQGIGSALMAHLHQDAQARAITPLMADVSLAAEAFFAAHGFTVQQRQTVLIRGETLANARMIKRLPFDGRH